MAVSREEIRIQLGIDNSKLTSGVSRANGIVQRFSDGVMRMFTRIGAAFVAAFGAQRIIQSLRDVAPPRLFYCLPATPTPQANQNAS